jgi:ubiquitin-conjugating enzyme E2 W
MSFHFRKRLLKELKDLSEEPLENVKILNSDDMTKLKVEISGAEGTLYEGEAYTLKIDIPHNYPIEPPEVVFVDAIPVNEHVYSNGHIHPLRSMVTRSHADFRLFEHHLSAFKR